MVKSAIKDAAQLKGQAIAISRYGSSTDQAVDFALKHLGIKRDDVKVLQLGGPSTRIAAIRAVRSAARWSNIPTPRA